MFQTPNQRADAIELHRPCSFHAKWGAVENNIGGIIAKNVPRFPKVSMKNLFPIRAMEYVIVHEAEANAALFTSRSLSASCISIVPHGY